MRRNARELALQARRSGRANSCTASDSKSATTNIAWHRHSLRAVFWQRTSSYCADSPDSRNAPQYESPSLSAGVGVNAPAGERRYYRRCWFIVIFEDPPVYDPRPGRSGSSFPAVAILLGHSGYPLIGVPSLATRLYLHGAVGPLRDQINEIFCEFHLVMRAVEKPLKADIASPGMGEQVQVLMPFDSKSELVRRQCFTTDSIGSKSPHPIPIVS